MHFIMLVLVEPIQITFTSRKTGTEEVNILCQIRTYHRFLICFASFSVYLMWEEVCYEVF